MFCYLVNFKIIVWITENMMNKNGKSKVNTISIIIVKDLIIKIPSLKITQNNSYSDRLLMSKAKFRVLTLDLRLNRNEYYNFLLARLYTVET